MTQLRRWQLDAASPYCLHLAADARLSPTDYNDDQSWELTLGAQHSPALALHTRYGGRVGLASLVPMWLHAGRSIYEAQAYEKPPYITAFAPGYVRIQATLKLQLALQAEYWVMDSHAIGVQFTLANAHVAPTQVRLNLLAHVGAGGKEQPLGILPLPKGGAALHLGKAGNLYPVVVMEGASAEAGEPTLSVSPHIGRDLNIGGRKKAVVRWVHAGLADMTASLNLASRWLKADWNTYFDQIAAASLAVPDIETGDEELDATIAFAYQALAQSFLKPTPNLPHASFVATRQPGRGYSPRGDGGDHDRAWSGQSPTLAYTTALAMAAVNPDMAQGIVRNYLAVQRDDGWIDWKPGLGGQRQGILCLPILARLAWGIFQYSEDSAFISAVFPGLLKFFERWLQPDLDADRDGLPEWQSENQTGYVFTPTFAVWQTWGQKADIRLVEAPDLAAYLLSEAISLREMAYFLRQAEAEQRLDQHIAALQNTLETLWRSDRYAYRDRDTHQTTTGRPIISGKRGDEDLRPAETLSPPSRLIVQVHGGVNLAPRVTLRLDGLDSSGQPISETVASEAFVWGHGRGSYTTHQVFGQLDRVTANGLSRVYRIDVHTLDTTGLDISALLPLWSVGITPERSRALIALLTDPAHFWRAAGVTMCSAQDAHYDPANREGSGGVWPFWLTLMGEGLIEYGAPEQAADLLRRLLNAQKTALKTNKTFHEFYHADTGQGLGEAGHLGGIVPLHLLLRVLGVRIISPRKVWTGGPFTWAAPVTVHQHGVTVRRSSQHTQVVFPSGCELHLSNDSWHEVVDPTARGQG